MKLPADLRAFIVITVLVAANGCGKPEPGPASAQAGGGDIKWTCNEKSECDVVAVTSRGERLQVFKGVALSPSARRLSDRLSEFRVSCGSPCSSSIFVDFDARRVSPPFENVLASDPVHQLVAAAGVDQVEIRPIFGPADRVIAVKRDFAPAAALVSAVRGAEFLATGSLKLRYLRGPMYEEVEEVISFERGLFGVP